MYRFAASTIIPPPQPVSTFACVNEGDTYIVSIYAPVTVFIASNENELMMVA